MLFTSWHHKTTPKNGSTFPCLCDAANRTFSDGSGHWAWSVTERHQQVSTDIERLEESQKDVEVDNLWPHPALKTATLWTLPWETGWWMPHNSRHDYCPVYRSPFSARVCLECICQPITEQQDISKMENAHLFPKVTVCSSAAENRLCDWLSSPLHLDLLN